MAENPVAAALARAEDRLRAEGLTGGRAFEALLLALRARLGEDVEALPAAAEAVRDMPLEDDHVDLLGLAYERFFDDLFKGKRGQYFTPRPLVELLLSRLDVGPGKRILDPTCGSGGFLVVAGRRGASVLGIEKDPFLADLASVNLRLAGVDGEVRCDDFFAVDPEPLDAVVANPPFSVEVTDPEVLARYDLGDVRGRVLSDWLFIEALERWVRPGGQAAVVLPWSIVGNPTAAALRRRIDRAWRREAMCALPEGVFRPFGGAAGRAALLWLRRRPAPEAVTMWAALDDPGWDVGSERLRFTDDLLVRALEHGEGWRALEPGRWTPRTRGILSRSRPLGDLVGGLGERVKPSRQPDAAYSVIDLGDADKLTGEIITSTESLGREIKGHKAAIADDDVLVSRLRPELGNVAVAHRPPGAEGRLVGSPEWITLHAKQWPHFLAIALRTPSWRAQLPATEGQTRPRTSADRVMETDVPWPGDALAQRIDALSRNIADRRAELRERLVGLQGLMDRFARGELDESELKALVAQLEEGQ